MDDYPIMDPPHVKSACRRENQMSNPMGIGLGIEYAAWGDIHFLSCPRQKKFAILYV